MNALGRLLVAAALARGADAAAAVVIVLASVQSSGSPAQGAIVLAALLVPHVVAGPLAGVVTDRAARPRVVHALFVAVFGVCVGAVPLLLGRAPLAVILLLAAVAGCCGPMILGGLSSRLDDVTPTARRPHARGLDAATYNVAQIAGPAAGATVTGLFGAATAAVMLAVTAWCAAAILLTVGGTPTAGPGGARFVHTLRAGLACVVTRPVLRATTAASVLAEFGLGALTPAAVLVGIDSGHATGGGYLVTAFGAGALVGSLSVARFPVRRWPPFTVALVCIGGTGAALAAVAVGPSWWPLTVGLFAVAGVFDGPLLTSLLQIRATEAPAHLRTQVFTISTGLKTSTAALGATAFAVVASSGAAVGVGLIAAAHLVAVVVGLALRAAPDSTAGAKPDRRTDR
ncbi:MFS transporter [Polymorphospora rubra]|uniref:MFS transporter n=1 Tax=Polymorphospora rubra TaxID=338584 RepID=UPI00340CD2CE